MIPLIGVMIGSYIITRMFELMGKPGIHTAVKAFSVITVLVTIFCVIGILNAGSSISPMGFPR